MCVDDDIDDKNQFDLELDYEQIYKSGWRPDPTGTACDRIPVGLCTRMCTSQEMYEREKQKRLNKYETKPNTKPAEVDPRLAMKEYTRSAAGRTFVNPIDLRPWSSLKRSLHHLLLDICLRDDDWMLICDFVYNRLSSIRQDMVVQRIKGRRRVEVLEGSVRFLVYSMYRLTCTVKDYTQQLPFKVILSPEGSPVNGLDNYEVGVVREMKLTMQCLRDCLLDLIEEYDDHVPYSTNRPLFEALNLIVNLPFLHGGKFRISRYLTEKDSRDGSSMFKIVLKMYTDHMNGHHLSALKKLPHLLDYPLLIIAYAPVIAQLQIQLLTSLKKFCATRASNIAHPDYLSRILCPDWLEVSQDERRIFAIFLAVQFGIYNDDKDCCDFSSNTTNKVIIPRDFAEKAWLERKRQIVQEDSDNETRIYAMQMITGRNWSYYQDTLNTCGLADLLDPTQAGK